MAGAYAAVNNYREGIPARVFLNSVHERDSTLPKGVPDADLLNLGRTACLNISQTGTAGFQAGVEKMAAAVGQPIAFTIYESADSYLCPSRIAR